ncbi:hypothetical protein D3C72_2099310 [compost metagenome]
MGLEAGIAHRVSTDYDQCHPHDSYKEFTDKVLIHVKKRARMWSGETVLNLTVDERVVKRVAGSAEYLKEFPDFKEAVVGLPVGRG